MAQHHEKKDTSDICVLLQHCAGGAQQVTGSVADRNSCLLSLPAFHRDIFPKGSPLHWDGSCLPAVGPSQQCTYLSQQGLTDSFQIYLCFLQFTLLTRKCMGRMTEIFPLSLTLSWAKGDYLWHEKRQPRKLITVL